MKPIVSVGEVNRRLAMVHGDIVRLVEHSYNGTAKKATFIDVEYGEWTAYVSNVLVGHCHPERGKKRAKTTNLARYGSVSPMSNKEIIAKKEATNLKRYGVKNSLSSPQVQAKRDATMLERYGETNPQRVPSIRTRTNKSLKRSAVLKHWKTGDDVVCTASWERAVVEWLNVNQVDFAWQVPIRIPTDGVHSTIAGRTYFVDLQVLNGPLTGVYVEVKGAFARETQRLKWDWFKTLHPTAQLWNFPVLKALGIDLRKNNRGVQQLCADLRMTMNNVANMKEVA